MTTIDIRNETWESIQGRVVGDRKRVLKELLNRLQPCSTRELAAVLGMEVLSVRPRVTELLQLGLVRFVERGPDGGLYKAVPELEALADFRRRQAEAAGTPQLRLV